MSRNDGRHMSRDFQKSYIFSDYKYNNATSQYWSFMTIKSTSYKNVT